MGARISCGVRVERGQEDRRARERQRGPGLGLHEQSRAGIFNVDFSLECFFFAERPAENVSKRIQQQWSASTSACAGRVMPAQHGEARTQLADTMR